MNYNDILKDMGNESMILNTFSTKLVKTDFDEDFDILESVLGKELLSRLEKGEKAIDKLNRIRLHARDKEVWAEEKWNQGKNKYE